MGLDLSLTSTGVAWSRGGEIVQVERVRTSGSRDATLPQRRDRLNGILQRLHRIIIDGDPELVVVEAPSFGSQHGSAHDRSGLWWLVMDMLCDLTQYRVATVSPQGRAKYATGKGRADKQEVFDAVCSTYGHFSPVRKVQRLGWRQGNDMADAVLLAAMGSRRLGHPIEQVSEAQYQAYIAADWPIEQAAFRG